MAKPKKRKVVISDEKGGGYYVEYFSGKELTATKVVLDKGLNKLLRMKAVRETTDNEFLKSARAWNYEWHFSFEDNPGMLRKLKRAKAKGLESDWKGISCPYWMATEVK